MKYIVLILSFLLTIPAMAQQAEAALEKDSKTLNERFAVMKDKSETFNEYKVIKAYILNGMWKITQDTLQKKDEAIAAANDEINQLKSKLNASLAQIKQKEESMEEIVHASTHINVLGIDFGKAFFIGLMASIFVGLLLIVGVVTGRLKMMYYSLKDRMDSENMITKEFENYKRKALEKQMKLSRELQDERNKMAEMRSA